MLREQVHPWPASLLPGTNKPCWGGTAWFSGSLRFSLAGHPRVTSTPSPCPCPTAASLAPAHPCFLPEPLRPNQAVWDAAQPVSSTSLQSCSGRSPRKTLRDGAVGQAQPQQLEQELSTALRAAHTRMELLRRMFWCGWAQAQPCLAVGQAGARRAWHSALPSLNPAAAMEPGLKRCLLQPRHGCEHK